MGKAKRTHHLGRPEHPWRAKLHEIIFEAETNAGKAFDVALLVAISLSTLTVMLETVGELAREYVAVFHALEWGFTLLFTVEYALRLFAVGRPLRYVFSFFGVVDLLSILPTYLSFFLAGSQSLLVIRSFRLLRAFRIFKLGRYLVEANVLLLAIRRAGPKIVVFLATVLIVVVIMGSLMYLIEGDEGGFTSIPRGMYWAIVTMTTVGYGDVAPQTVLGQALASILMVIGYSVLAVPTGIVSVEMVHAYRKPVTNFACRECGGEGHDDDARFCKYCGSKL